MIVITPDNFNKEVLESKVPVVLDCWRPGCHICEELEPQVEELNKEYAGKVKFAKLNVSDYRAFALANLEKKVMFPTYYFFVKGEIIDKLYGTECSLSTIKAKVKKVLELSEVKEVSKFLDLKFNYFYIKEVKFGSKTEIKEGVLFINSEELTSKILEDPRIKTVVLDIAYPGESVRIMPVKDVVEPRTKVNGGKGYFSGVLGEPQPVGEGITNALKGVGVVTVGKMVAFQEGIIDMSGPGAQYSIFSRNINICLVIEPVEKLERYAHEEALRLAGFKTANYLAEASVNLEPCEVKHYVREPMVYLSQKYPDLPKVGYAKLILAQGLLHDTYVYGLDAKKMITTVMEPMEAVDGAIVSGNCVSACDKSTTYHHQNDPVIFELLEKHGKEVNFITTILAPEGVTLEIKKRSTYMVGKIAKSLGLDGAVVTQEGFGNPDTDLMLACRNLERNGIKTVLITDEYAGRDGSSQSLADATPEATAVVSSGNANELITIPPMKKIIGNKETVKVIAGGSDDSLNPDGSMTVELQVFVGATNQLGFTYLSAKTI
ncbi:MAG: Glycine reductase complex component B subunits alpha and beta [candidate division WS2 bacterium]|nr:Glycine reductase complex component B subunits alpha and beta [Candidatus Psychracetigena formicireducens]